jgi:hypothetical protein
MKMSSFAAQSETQTKKRRAGGLFNGAIAMALIALAVTGIGFWRSFFSQLGKVDSGHILHGITMTGWLVLVLLQATLIRTRDFKLHRILGWSSLVVFVLMIATSYYMLTLMLGAKTPGLAMPFEIAKIFAYADVTAIPLMIICYTGAIILRKDRHIHSRLMAITTMAILLPALGRMFMRLWPGMNGLIFSMNPSYIFVLSVLGIAMFLDWKKDQLRWPFPFAFIWFAISYATLFPGESSAWFDHLARAIATS